MNTKHSKPDLPPLGPGWAGAVMGLGITASLMDIHLSSTLGHLPAELMLGAATLLALALTVGFHRHRNPGFHSSAMPAWGMASMGILALGSAYSLIFGAWLVHAFCWAVGTVLGAITCVKFIRYLFVSRPAPAFTWGLPLVAPMVAATASAQLAPHAGAWSSAVHGIGVACFALAWVTAVPTFAFVYARTFPTIPTQFATTAWIPLGLVGQSTVAAQLLAGDQWHFRATVYGLVILSVGIPLAGYAIIKHWGTALGSAPMPYNPTWWASTFPVGTCCLGTHTLAEKSTNSTLLVWDLGWMDTLSAALLALLLLHVVWAALGARKLSWRPDIVIAG
ncbi:tellurite resistance protein [Corynebacterium jeikeium]|uniref:SLAC1 family transporter n=1 Tax=Corynebacterium jeikeium TaxID=38289 RepID=UPI00054E3B00|nr:tellurite resistance protein [Corynebacterium jeikeium]